MPPYDCSRYSEIHPFVKWIDRDSNKGRCLDLDYMEQWCHDLALQLKLPAITLKCLENATVEITVDLSHCGYDADSLSAVRAEIVQIAEKQESLVWLPQPSPDEDLSNLKMKMSVIAYCCAEEIANTIIESFFDRLISQADLPVLPHALDY